MKQRIPSNSDCFVRLGYLGGMLWCGSLSMNIFLAWMTQELDCFTWRHMLRKHQIISMKKWNRESRVCRRKSELIENVLSFNWFQFSSQSIISIRLRAEIPKVHEEIRSSLEVGKMKEEFVESSINLFVLVVAVCEQNLTWVFDICSSFSIEWAHSEIGNIQMLIFNG